VLLFDLKPDAAVNRKQLAMIGDVRTPSIADLFVAIVGNQNGQAPAQQKGAAQ
jgi:hypothetical protein